MALLCKRARPANRLSAAAPAQPDMPAPPAAATPASLPNSSIRSAHHVAAEPESASAAESGTEIDPVTERVVRAAREASETAAFLFLRESPNLSRKARLELIDQIAALAGPAINLLQTLTSDPDKRVRTAAREALERLSRA